MGKRLAVLVGCNYPSYASKLYGCINDVVAMRVVLLERFGFDSSHIELLTDVFVPGTSWILPTRANIMAALNRMVDKAEAGDVLFFHFSGHGTLLPNGQGEAIVSCELNLITDVDLSQLIRRLPKGTSFTLLSDSCHSGGLIDKDKEQIGPHTVEKIIPSVYHRPKSISFEILLQYLESASNSVQGTTEEAPTVGSLLSGIFGEDVSPKFLPQLERDLSKSLDENEGILLSGCQANETSADMPGSESSGGKAYGAFTSAVRQVLAENTDALSNRQLVMMTRKIIKEQGLQQHPCLYCSDENADATFLGQPKQLMHKQALLA